MMARLGSFSYTIPWYRRLEARVLLGVTLIAGLSLVAVALITQRVVRSHTFSRAQMDLAAAEATFGELITTRVTSAEKQSDLIAGLPVFRAHMLEQGLAEDHDTMEAMASDYCQKLSATFCVVTNAKGLWLASPGVDREVGSDSTLEQVVHSAVSGTPRRRIIASKGKLFLIVARPAMFADEVLGSLSAGYSLDDEFARGLSRATRSEIALVAAGNVSGTSFSGDRRDALEQMVQGGIAQARRDVRMWSVAGASYVGGVFPLRLEGEQLTDGGAILLEDWSPTEHFIDDIVRQLAWAGAVVFLLGVIGSIVLSRRMSRPLRDIADHAERIAAGQWDSRLPVRGSAEAVVMSNAFNDMTRSLTHWRSEAVQKADQLRAAYERYAAVTNSAPDAIVSVSASGEVVFWNESAHVAFGYSEEEALGLTWADLVAESHREICAQMIGEVIATESGVRRLEARAVRQEDGEFPCEITMAPWRAGGVSFLTLIVRDITERRRAEEALQQRDLQLRQAQKMEAIGRLASGVAHDFNNALAVIQGYTEEVLERIGGDHPATEDLREVLKASQSGASLTRQLLAFSRRQNVELQSLSLSGVIRDVQKMLRRLVGEDVELTTELVGNDESSGDDTADDLVHADRGQIEQVVVNLCVNARDAMPEGGHLTVRVCRSMLEGDACERLGLPAGAYVTLSVADTGHGMDADTAARIFEPFFTTKEAGKGTGLGLATVYAIVKQCGGVIALDTAPGRGTTFSLHFPFVQAADDEPGEVVEEVDSGHGTVLVVEDEAPVRAIVRRTLEREGYAVLDAASGAEALELLREHRGTIDVLLTDVMMPGLNGVALSQAVVQQRPSTRVLFMSGHPGDTFARHGLDVSSARLLQKPFSTESLCRELQGVLAAPAH